MAGSYFMDKETKPTTELLKEALGDSFALWSDLEAWAGTAGEWKFSKSAGWNFPAKAGKRTLFYLMPKQGWFTLVFVYGGKAVEAAKGAGLPPQVLEDLLNARVYVEGRSVEVAVKSPEDLETAKRMVQIKREN